MSTGTNPVDFPVPKAKPFKVKWAAGYLDPQSYYEGRRQFLRLVAFQDWIAAGQFLAQNEKIFPTPQRHIIGGNIETLITLRCCADEWKQLKVRVKFMANWYQNNPLPPAEKK
jgi:hypothetical protein